MQRLAELLHLLAHQVQAFPARALDQRIDLVELQDRRDQVLAGLVVQLVGQPQALPFLGDRQVPAQADHQMGFCLAFRFQLRVGERQIAQQAVALGQQGGDRQAPQRGEGHQHLHRQHPLRGIRPRQNGLADIEDDEARGEQRGEEIGRRGADHAETQRRKQNRRNHEEDEGAEIGTANSDGDDECENRRRLGEPLPHVQLMPLRRRDADEERRDDDHAQGMGGIGLQPDRAPRNSVRRADHHRVDGVAAGRRHAARDDDENEQIFEAR